MKTRITKTKLINQICGIGLMLCLWLGVFNPGFGQTLGGLPNPNFNPGDTGASSLPSMFYRYPDESGYHLSFFIPSFDGGVISYTGTGYNQYGNIYSFNHIYRNGLLLFKGYKNFYLSGQDISNRTSPSGVYASKVYSVNPDLHILVQDGYPDSINYLKLERKNDIVKLDKYFSRLGANFSDSILWSQSFCALNSGKYLSLYRVNVLDSYKIRFEILDSVFKPTGIRRDINVSQQSYLPYFLSMHSLNGSVISILKKPASGDTLTLLKLDQNLNLVMEKSFLFPYAQNIFGGFFALGKEPFSVRLLPDDKILFYGPSADQKTETCIRLLPNGDVDPSFQINIPSGSSGVKFDYGVDGKLRVAWIQSVANVKKSFWAEVNQNGGLENIVTGVLDSWLIPERAVMYHPELNAFLFETDTLYPGFSGYGNKMVYRFYVLSSGITEPLVKAQGLHPSPYDPPLTQVTPAYRTNKRLKQIVIQNSLQNWTVPDAFPDRFVQYNGVLSPGLLILNKDGSFANGFKSSLAFPRKFLDSTDILTSGYNNQTQIVGGKKVLIGNQIDKRLCRFNFSGERDLSFFRYKVNGNLFELKNGKFLALDWDTGYVSNPPTGNLRVLNIDSLGNFVSIKKQIPVDPIFDLPAQLNYRNVRIIGEDNKGGVWFYTSTTGFYDGYLSRLDTSGDLVKIFSDSLMLHEARSIFSINLPENVFSALFFDVLPNGNFQIWTPSGAGGFSKFLFNPQGQFISRNLSLVSGLQIFGNYPAHVTMTHRQRDGKFLAIVESTGRYMTRFFQDGRLDPSFVPFVFYGGINETFILDDQLINTHLAPGHCGPLKKSGLYGFNLNSGTENSGFVQGKVELVPGNLVGCSPVGPRTPAYLSLLSSSPGNSLAFSNKSGFYSFALNPGNYAIKQENANLQFKNQICPEPATPNHLVNLSTPGQVELNKNFINGVYACSKLSVSILQPRFRLCSKSSFTLQYQNSGILAEPNARILVSMPKLVKILSANRPFTIRPDSTYVFDIGNLNPGQSGSILVRDTVGCVITPDSNARACFSVRMEPLSICSQFSNSGWNGAWLDGKAKYNPANGQVRYVITNRGQNQTDSTSLNIFYNGGFVRTRMVKLSAGDSTVLLIPSSVGATSIVVEQPANCPHANIGEIRHSGVSTANFYMSFSGGWLANQTITACPNFRFSYDPNEKIVEPVDPVLPGKELNYTIHFENLGNDTAYVVYIADTLPDGVDIRSFRMVGSSHPCEAMVGGTLEKPVLAFNFMPIRLPGKKQNPVLSKGQVDFKISLRDNVALGSQHRNRAHIYFDRNEPIITNTVVTKVIDPNNTTAVEELKAESRLLVYPNPNKGSFTITLPKGFSNNRIVIGDIQGRVIKELKSNEKSENAVSGLQSGLYLIYLNGLKPVKVMVE